MRSATRLVLGLLSLAGRASAQAGSQAAQALAAAQEQGYHVLELYDSETATMEQVLGIFGKMGVGPEQATPLIEKVSKAGKAVVIAGPQESCESVAALFGAISMKTVVRPLDESDVPGASEEPAAGAAAGAAPKAAGAAAMAASEYDGSDVIVADAETLQRLAADPAAGTLVTFYAPWCGHCRTMVPEYKKAATALKAQGVRVAAIDCDAHKGAAQAYGVKGFPSVKFVFKGKATDYGGERKAAGIVAFAQSQAAIAKVLGGVSNVLGKSKAALSKVLGGGAAAGGPAAGAAGGVAKAVAPAAGAA